MQFFKTLLVTICCCLYLNSDAQTWTGNFSTDWFDGANWSSATIPTTGDSPSIPAAPISGNFPEINMPLTADFSIENYGTLTINAAVSLINTSSLVNYPDADIALTTNGSLEIGADANYANQGLLQNEGSLINNGNIDNDGDMMMGVAALFINNAGAYLRNDNTITNNNLIQNHANFDNFGLIHNLAILENNGNCNVMQGSTFYNGAGVVMGTLINTVNLTIGGDFENNAGELNNQGQWTIQASGEVMNNAMIINAESLTNSGLITNDNIFINRGSILNEFGNSTIDNNNQFINESCQLIFLQNTNALENVENQGIIDAKSGAMVTTIPGGDGIVLIEAEDVARPTALCVPDFTVHLEVDGELILTAEQIDNESTADYCVLEEISISPNTFDCSDVGEQVITLLAIDENKISSSCQTTVTIIPPAPSVMACEDQINVSIHYNCEPFELTPDLILSGSNYTCVEGYEVEIAGLPNNILMPHHVGQTFTVSIIEPHTGDNCWGTILYEDKTGPIFTNCGTEEILCIQNLLPVSEGGDVVDPTFVDCPGVSLTYQDSPQNGDCEGALIKIIERTWTATDASGNISRCTQTINIRNASISSYPVSCPDDLNVECVSATETLDPARTGYPYVTIDAVEYELSPDDLELCGLVATYRDDTIPACGAGYTLYRHWTIMDWCVDFGSPNSSFVCTQLIKYIDTTGPSVQIPANMEVSSQNFNCGALVNIPPATISDCSDYEVTIITPSGNINANGGWTPGEGLTGGDNIITYRVEDACGNVTNESFVITVGDDAPPVVICKDRIHISLSVDGFAGAFPNSFDDGSFDACGIERMELERMEAPCNPNITTEPDDFVTFSCCDIADSPLMVTLRVFDHAGNFNECMTEVIVEDKIPPTIVCPADKVLSCDSDYTNLDITSQPVGNDNCSSFTFDYDDNVDVTDCGIGTVYRTWTATSDQNETASCVQTIELINTNPFNGDEDIRWPDTYTAYGCGAATEPDVTGYPIVNEGDCSTVLASHHDQVFEFVDGVCFKIIRTWTIIDWCQPGEEWTRAQIIKVLDNVAPVLDNCDDREFCNNSQDCSMSVALPVTIADDCIDVEDLHVSWAIDAFNDGILDNGAAYFGTGQHTEQNYPNGTHSITYRVADGCGNETTCNFLFTIKDCKAPTPVCIHGLSINLMETGMVMVSPHLFENGSSFDNCSTREELTFSFSTLTNDVERIYTCENLGTNPIELWVTDPLGNQAYCETFIAIQDNFENCDGEELEGATVAGFIHTENGDMLEGVEVMANHTMSPTMTGLDGSFRFEGLPMYQDYTIQAQKNTDFKNGVSTLDLVLIQKHIIGVQPLETPYQIIAADANNSATITSYDIVEIRKLILNKTEAFEYNNSWRFMDDSYEFLDPTDPFAEDIPEQVFLTDLDHHALTTNFIAIKVGDVNGSALPNSLVTTADRSQREKLVFNLQNKKTNIRETLKLDFTAEDISAVSGFQFTLEANQNALEILELIPSENMSMANFGMTMLDKGIITVSWDNVEDNHLTDVLFSLKMRATQAGQLSDWISIHDDYTVAEAYAKDTDELMNVEANFETGTMLAMSDIVLYQNSPNPFGQSTSIRFFLPLASMASLTISDVSGRTIQHIKGNFASGMNEIKWNAATIKAKGVLYYRLETPTYTATRKMVRQ